MVITTSESCNTLVSVDDGSDHKQQRYNDSSLDYYWVTELFLSPGNDSRSPLDDRRLHFPLVESVDEYLMKDPQTVVACEDLLSCEPRRFDRNSRERFLYVYQGEVAHATSLQCDVLVSDKATTCHILALHSQSGTKPPLTSLTHIDCPAYEGCVREMFDQHKSHHGNEELINIDIHVVGGFNDDNRSSQEISNWLMDLLANIAMEEKHYMKCILRTCAISSMNDNGQACPIARGLGIHLRTGNSFLAKVDQNSCPGLTLRTCRLWSSGHVCQSKLTVLHTSTSNELTISPFYYAYQKYMDNLAKHSDNTLLIKTSTSPTVEENDFCCNIRKTLRFMRKVRCSQVFGSRCSEAVVFRRVGRSNKWFIVT